MFDVWMGGVYTTSPFLGVPLPRDLSPDAFGVTTPLPQVGRHILAPFFVDGGAHVTITHDALDFTIHLPSLSVQGLTPPLYRVIV